MLDFKIDDINCNTVNQKGSATYNFMNKTLSLAGTYLNLQCYAIPTHTGIYSPTLD